MLVVARTVFEADAAEFLDDAMLAVVVTDAVTEDTEDLELDPVVAS